MTFLVGQTGVIVPVPEAEPVVAQWRERFDPSAAVGVPAHVTVIYPFVPLDGLVNQDLSDLQAIFASRPRFSVTFSRCGRFPSVLYLAPDDEAPFRDLTAALVRRWPQAPPYGGAYGLDPEPHLTVTDHAEESVTHAAEAALSELLPLSAEVDAAWLIVFDGEQWRRRLRLPFG